MSNRLASANSPYLQQHADNPVNWQPWDERALQQARSEDKPIFLSIGYAACHWCHVMAHESFEDPQIAEILNEHFVNIKVDREERPDLDSIYMNAVVAMTGQGGWPMSVFLTPEMKPFFGGAYFPPVRRYNIPSFKEIILTIVRLWKDERGKLFESSDEVTKRLLSSQAFGGESDRILRQETIEQATMRLAQSYDWKNGGWGPAPKFPQPMAIEFLLRRASQGERLAMDVAVHALDAMARGGIFDLIGGGFARYSTDNEWLVPHFEKMLYDNALLARCYLYAHLLTNDERYLSVCRATLDFVRREMTNDEGGFYSSLDADSEGEEGKFYLWTFDELMTQIEGVSTQLPAANRVNWAEVFIDAFGVSRAGNFEGEIVLQRKLNDLELADMFSLSLTQIRRGLGIIQRRLFDERQARVRPGTDDKTLVAWNALMLQTFSEAARYLKDPVYLKAAQSNAAFLMNNLLKGDRLCRSWRNGSAQHNAYLEDYAALALGLFSLYQTDYDPTWFNGARRLIERIMSDFPDPAGGFFDTPERHEALLFRPKDIQDNAVPCGNSLAVMALLQFSAFTGEGVYRDKAEAMLAAIDQAAARYPTAFGNWLCAYDLCLARSLEIAVLFPALQSDISAFSDVIWSAYRPNWILAASQFPAEAGSPEILRDRGLIDNNVTVFVCEKFFCRQPVSTPEALEQELRPFLA